MVDTFGSSFDTVVAVYTGSGLSNLTQVACAEKAAPPWLLPPGSM